MCIDYLLDHFRVPQIDIIGFDNFETPSWYAIGNDAYMAHGNWAGCHSPEAEREMIERYRRQGRIHVIE